MWLTSSEIFPVLLNAPSTGGASNTTTETCKHINMGKYGSAMFIIALGTNSVTTSNFYLMQASTDTAAGTYAGPYYYRTSSTAASYTGSTDALSTRVAGTGSTALVLNSTAETMYVIEVKSDDQSAGYPYLYPSISSAAATRNASIIAFLKPRYPQNNMMTVNT
jgi:hypothetical protein